jgi:hypothetical protein
MNKPFEVCLRLVLPLSAEAFREVKCEGGRKTEKVSCKLGLKIACNSQELADKSVLITSRGTNQKK